MARTPDFDLKRILVVLLGGASDQVLAQEVCAASRVDLINLGRSGEKISNVLRQSTSLSMTHARRE